MNSVISLTSLLRMAEASLATFETSLYDEEGNQRNDFGLSDLFGISYDQAVEGPMQNSYLASEERSFNQTVFILYSETLKMHTVSLIQFTG